MEICPHHLLIDLERARQIGPYARCAPPIRERALVESMWRFAARGEIDCLISDHSPYTVEEKLCGADDVFEAGLGCQVIQEMVPLTLSAWLHERGLPWSAFVRFASTRPAQILGLFPQKGTILPGSDADIVIVDSDSWWTVRAAEQQFSRSKWSPFEGYESRVRICRTLVRGETVYDSGEIRAEPGFGSSLWPPR
jgi:allantoinase